jgi:hypothetical protein
MIAAELPALNLARGLSHFSSRLLSWEDREMVLGFRKSIFALLPAQFRLLDPALDDIEHAELQWAETYLRSPGLTLGVFCHGKLIAFASSLLPRAQGGGDPSRLLQLSDADIERSAQMSACMVAPEFRGMRLQSKLLNWRKDMAILSGRTLLVSMTACGNIYSLRNMLEIGMSIRWIGELKRQRWWQVLALDMRARRQGDAKMEFSSHVCVDAENYTKQAELVGKGFEGLVMLFRPDAAGNVRGHFEFAKRISEAR